MLAATGALPDALIACVGGGSNSMGAFHAFIPDSTVEIIGVEAGRRGAGPGENAPAPALGRARGLDRTHSLLPPDEDGPVPEARSGEGRGGEKGRDRWG